MYIYYILLFLFLFSQRKRIHFYLLHKLNNTISFFLCDMQPEREKTIINYQVAVLRHCKIVPKSITH